MSIEITNVLRSILITVRRLMGGYGTYLFTDTTAHAVKFTSIIPTTDTVIAELYCSDKPTVNLIATANTNYRYNFSGVTLTTADLIVCESGKEFSKIKLTSGGVKLY